MLGLNLKQKEGVVIKIAGKQLTSFWSGLLLLVGAPAAAWADDTETLATALQAASQELQAEEDEIQWRSEAQVGFLDSRGKTESRTVNGRLRVQAETLNWRNDTRTNFLYTQTDEVTTQESVTASHQIDYQWTRQLYSLTFGGYSYDRFNTFRHEYDLVGGIGYRVYRQEEREWDLEAGVGAKYTERNLAPEDTDWSPLGRLASKFRQELREDLEFQQEIAYNRSQEVESLTILNSLAVKANENLAVSLSYEWRRTEDLDASDAEYDHITTLNLIYRWQP